MARSTTTKAGSAVRARVRLAPAERMDMILAAALEEFALNGYAGASMAATAARAGIAKALIYHYFPGKADLFKAVVRSSIQPVFSAADRMVASAEGPKSDLLRGLIELAYRRVTTQRREQMLFRLILTESDRFPELADFYHAEVFAPGLALFRAAIAAGVASGEFRPEAAAALDPAPVVVAPAVMAAVWRMILGPARAPDPQAMLAAHVDLVLAGLRA